MAMRLGISNLAWGDLKTPDLIPMLIGNNIKYIEVVLPKHINWNNANLTELQKFHDHLEYNGILIKSTQSIFFNSGIDNYYDDGFVNHIVKVSDICREIGVTHLVLGAPNMRKNEDPVGLGNKFSYIDNVVRENNQILLLEPNSRIYGGNYFYKVDEIVRFIDEIKFSNIRTMIDTHNIILEGEDPTDVFLKYREYIKHVHVSEANLSGFISSNRHKELAKTLKENEYSGLIIYEAKPTLNLVDEIKNFSKTYNI
jgi:sugar phosphate isomerase/epimerase